MSVEKPKSFEVAVALLYSQGSSKAEAMSKARADYPELHQEYISRVNSGGKCGLSVLLETARQGKPAGTYKEEIARLQALGYSFAEAGNLAGKKFYPQFNK